MVIVDAISVLKFGVFMPLGQHLLGSTTIFDNFPCLFDISEIASDE